MILSPLFLAIPLLVPQAPQSAQGVALPDAGSVVIRSAEGEMTRGALAEWLLATYGELSAPGFADCLLFAREARALGLPDVTAEAGVQVEAEIQERIQKAYGGREDGWLNELKQARRTPAGRRAEREIELIRDLNLRDIAAHERTVPPEKVLRDWEREYGPGGRRFRVRLFFRRVVMPPMQGLSRAEQVAERDRIIAEQREQVDAIRARALAGESFPGLVRDLSEDPVTRGSGGRPRGDFLDPIGWPSESLDAIAALTPGGITEPIFVRGGLWLVQLEELVETPFESVQDELLARLIARGPESDEIAAARLRIFEGIEVQTLPALHERAGTTGPLPADTPVLRIGGTDISRGEYAEHLLGVLGDTAAPRFVEEMRIERLAAEAGIAPTDAEIEARVEEDIAHLVEYFHKGDRARWEQETARLRGSVESWRRDAHHQRRMDLLIEALILRERVVTDDLLRQVWRARYGEGGRSLHLRMIRIDAIPPEMPEDVTPEEAQRLSEEALEAARVRAAEVAERAAEGQDFSVLVGKYSMDEATRKAGGDLPVGFDHSALPPEAVTAIEALKPGEVSGSIEAGISHFIFEMVAVRVVPLEDVADELRAELQSARPTNVETRGFYNVKTRDLVVEVLPELFR